MSEQHKVAGKLFQNRGPVTVHESCILNTVYCLSELKQNWCLLSHVITSYPQMT